MQTKSTINLKQNLKKPQNFYKNTIKTKLTKVQRQLKTQHC